MRKNGRIVGCGAVLFVGVVLAVTGPAGPKVYWHFSGASSLEATGHRLRDPSQTEGE